MSAISSSTLKSLALMLGCTLITACGGVMEDIVTNPTDPASSSSTSSSGFSSSSSSSNSSSSSTSSGKPATGQPSSSSSSGKSSTSSSSSNSSSGSFPGASLTVVFPAAEANVGLGLETVNTTLQVRTGNGEQPVTMTANSLPLKLDAQDAHLWYGRIPAVRGDTQVNIRAQYSQGSSTEIATTLHNTLIQTPQFQAYKAIAGREFFLDKTGILNELLANGVGVKRFATDLCKGTFLETNPAGTEAYVLGDKVCAINLDTGALRTLMPEQFGILQYNGMSYSAADNQLYISQYALNDAIGWQGTQILRINPVTGDKTLAFAGLEPNSSQPAMNAAYNAIWQLEDISVDPARSIVYGLGRVAISNGQETSAGMVAFNMATGKVLWKTAAASAASIERTSLDADALSVYDIFGNIIAQFNTVDGVPLAVTLAPLKRPAPIHVGSGPDLKADSLILDATGENLYASGNGLFRITVANSHRELLAPATCSPECEIELAGNTAYIAETTGNARTIYAVDIHSGAKQLVSGASRGSGPLLPHTLGMALSPDEQFLYTAEFWGASLSNEPVPAGPIMKVNIASGNRTNFWDTSTLEGQESQLRTYQPTDVMTYKEQKRSYIWLPRTDQIMVADLSGATPFRQGNFSVNVDRTSSPGYSAIAIDHGRKYLYLTNRASQPLIRIDVTVLENTLNDPANKGKVLYGSINAPYRFVTPDYGSYLGITPEAATGLPLGNLFDESHGNTTLALDSRNQIMYMTEPNGGVMAVSLLTGDRVMLSR